MDETEKVLDTPPVRTSLSGPRLMQIRMRALELSVEVTKSSNVGGSTIQLAKQFEDYILNGSGDTNGNR